MILYCSLHHGPPTWPDKLYELWDGRKACMCCIVELQANVERWWPELQGKVELQQVPLSLAEILHRLGLAP